MNKKTKTIFDSEQPVKWCGFINEFLWICAGANRKVLRQCPTDYAKYAGIGGTILTTAIMAMFSGGYALFSIFSDPTKDTQDTSVYLITFVFAVFWGLLIFNLDRFMVNTMYSDGTHKITKEELKGGMPRIVLAIFLGLVISTPIEMRIFDDKIKAQVIDDQNIATRNMRQTNQALANQIKELEDQKKGNSNRVYSLMAKRDSIANQAYKEATGYGLSGKSGIGNYTKQLQMQVKKLDHDIEIARSETEKANDAIDKQLHPLYKRQEDAGANIEQSVSAMNGFAAKFNALNEISGDSSSGLLWARIFIMFLFVAIEVIPTVFKMMIAFGPYDDLLRAETHRVKMLADKRISEINDEINTSLTISIEQNKQRLEAEMKANEKILNSIASVQSEVLEKAIEEWRKKELEKVNNDPSEYIKVDSGTD